MIISGQGMDVTAQAPIIGPSLHEPVYISDCTIDAKGGIGIDLDREWWSYTGAPQLVIERVRIINAKVGIRLDGFWNPKIDKCWVGGLTPESYTKRQLLIDQSIGIDLMGAQEAKITNCYIGGSTIGIRQGPAEQGGQSEGLEVGGCAIINTLEAIKVLGTPANVWGSVATPWCSIHDNHLFYLDHGIFLHNRYDVTIANNSICGSHLIDQWGVGIYGVGLSNVRLTGNNLWTTKPGQGHGIILDATTRATVIGNTVDPALKVGLWVTPSSKKVTQVGNVFDCDWPVIGV